MPSSSFGIAKQSIITQPLVVEENSDATSAHTILKASFARSDDTQALDYEKVKYVAEAQKSSDDDTAHAILKPSFARSDDTQALDYEKVKYVAEAQLDVSIGGGNGGGAASSSSSSIHWIG